ncbi:MULTISPECIES: SPOR domain-containing protein [unclassified Treponema]|uniref:SPOR domain-containing protein n=1 Tax=unclassified Treponema TaxID=2638727 RepID=UPI0020A3F4CC|nr:MULTISPECIES: SPOR domain-containing protein [unclassified Treponema]UTC65900.1 SPOR domain-containing protein [Treponema sp. OMZ 789]UTC68628.1 SPOR domain-containing protein [Treponema sp. OMZ 790]UTC71358.1 SPOR domain-containing protein [Treponema sp. OMZ 791]
MNKKVLFSLIFIISFSCIWAVWEGNGGIGSPTDFPPEGLFVRSDMFPKHTLLEITNLEKNIKARAVVIGPSGIPGLLVSLSPELGEKLNVPRGKVIRIRVFTPSPVNEDGDDGKDISTTITESQDLDSNPALFVASHSEAATVNLKPEKEKTEPVSKNNVSDTILYDDLPAAEPVVEETPLHEEETAPLPAEEKTTDVPAVEVVTPPEEKPEPVPEAPVITKTEIPAAPIEVPAITETYMEPAKENPPITVEPIKEPKPEKEAQPAPVSEVSTPQAPVKPEEKQAPVEVVDSIVEPVKETPPENKKVDIVDEITPKSEPVKEEPIADKSEEEPVEIEDIQEKPEETTSNDDTDSENIYTVENEEKEEETPVIPVITETPVLSSKLEKGKNYVQIIIYNDKENCDEVVEKYGKKYPMVVEEDLVKNKKRYTVFVGPLKVDEIGAALERFKKFGFKDAFLKKGR